MGEPVVVDGKLADRNLSMAFGVLASARAFPVTLIVNIARRDFVDNVERWIDDGTLPTRFVGWRPTSQTLGEVFAI